MCEFCNRNASWIFMDALYTKFLCDTEGCYLEAKEWSVGSILYAPLNS